MTKKLNEAGLSSELSGSRFFAHQGNTEVTPPSDVLMTTPNAPTQDSVGATEDNRQVERPAVPPAVRSPGRTPVRTALRRVINRYAFEFFQDQLDRLQELSLDQKLRGEKGSMSEMVREALDDYLFGKGDAR